MTAKEAVQALEATGELWSIGQLDAATVRKLNRMAAKGEIQKEQCFWPWIEAGTCTKTRYTK